MRYLKVLLAIAVLGAYPAVALAHKAPTKRQQAALVKALDGYAHEPVPGKCLKEQVSTANTSWAEVHFAFPVHIPAVCAKFVADGVVLFHYRAGKWRYVTAGSSFRNGNGTCALTRSVPRKVIADFKLC
jgi:hypothetical protein